MNRGISSDELDHLSLAVRRKMLQENKLTLLEDESKRISTFVKKENECCDLQGGSTMISRNLGDQQLEAEINDTNGHLMDNYSEGARLNRENSTFENPTPPEVLDRVRVESTSILSGTLAARVDNFAPAGVAVTKVKNEMFDDFDEDLDHVLLIERLRMLLSRFHIFLAIFGFDESTCGGWFWCAIG